MQFGTHGLREVLWKPDIDYSWDMYGYRHQLVVRWLWWGFWNYSGFGKPHKKRKWIIPKCLVSVPWDLTIHWELETIHFEELFGTSRIVGVVGDRTWLT